ncbi:MAG: ABC transporter ATP-binding protein [[Bacteroides] pectinophilus]|nr:ABC transporter ATP-binding protein [[Bacteroides] pectinophilus]
MKNLRIIKQLVVRFQGWRAILYFGEIILMGIINGITVVMLSDIIGLITDTAVSGGNIWDTDIVKRIIIFSVLEFGVSNILGVCYNNEAKRTGATMRNIVFGKALMLLVSFYENNHTGDFMSKLTYDTNMASGIFGSRFRRVMMPVIIVCVCVVPMFMKCPPVMAGLLVLCILSLALNLAMVPVLAGYSRSISDDNKAISRSVTDMLQGMETIRMFPLQSVIGQKYNEANERCGRNMKKQGRIESVVAALRNAFDLIGAVAFLAMGIIYIQKYNGKVGSLLALYTMYGAFQYNFLMMGQYIPSLTSWLVNAERVLEFLELPEESFRNCSDYNAANVPAQADVEFDNITFAYEGQEQKIFDGYNAAFTMGKSYAITGESGRGKSTLMKLLMGFYRISGGSIRIGGHDIYELGLENTRKLIAYIPQEPYMFHDTVRENIRNGNPAASDEEIIRAAKKANAHDFILQLENGYDTILGERGNTLSGGQRQRLAIARAILKNAPVIILDEATSALDNESEQLIQQSINDMKDGRLILMIAHRPSTIATADAEWRIV